MMVGHRALPLQDIKVADFGQMINVPMATKYLGDYGATIIQIESPVQSASRFFFPFADGIPGLNRSGTFATYASSKLSITVNMSSKYGLEIVKKIITWSDVLIENYAPGTMEKWGLSYNDVKILKPEIIMLSSSMLGGTGRYRNQKGTGEQLSSLAGFTNLTGYPDREPVGISNAYTDFITPFYIITTIIAAICHRQKTGKGIYIDLSQYEAGISFLSHLVLDYTTSSKTDTRDGNRCEYAAPHGSYRCKGKDKWCSIAVFTDKEWESLLRIIGDPEWSKDPKYNTLPGRKKNEDELNTLIEQWTVNYPAEEVMKMMQQGGVASGVVQSSKDLTEDPQVKYRNHFYALEQPEMGLFNHECSSFKLSKTPAKLKPAPCYGEHTEYICTSILGISDEEFIRLFNNGAFTGPAIEKEELSKKYFQKTI